MFPPIPSWNEVHPISVHFPIALLVAAAVLVILGLFVHRRLPGFELATLTIMVMGTAATFMAVATGEAGAELARRSISVDAVIELHEELAETSRWIFVGLTLLFAGIVALPKVVKRPVKPVTGIAVRMVFLLIYGGGLVFLANAAHEGGRLVHEFGVHAKRPASMNAPVGDLIGHSEQQEDEHELD